MVTTWQLMRDAEEQVAQQANRIRYIEPPASITVTRNNSRDVDIILDDISNRYYICRSRFVTTIVPTYGVSVILINSKGLVASEVIWFSGAPVSIDKGFTGYPLEHPIRLAVG